MCQKGLHQKRQVALSVEVVFEAGHGKLHACSVWSLEQVYEEILHAHNTPYWNDAVLEQPGFYVGISQQVPQLAFVSNPSHPDLGDSDSVGILPP